MSAPEGAVPAPAASPPRFDPKDRRAVTFALILVSALASFESTVVSTAMPTIIGELSGLPLYSWVFSIYLLGSTVSMPLYGRLADLYGRKRVLLTAITLFLLGAAACASARSMPELIGARALQGLGAGGLVPIALTISGDLYTLEERARVQGLFSGVWGLASLVGPLLGAVFTMTFGWRSIFSINLPLGVLAFYLVARRLTESLRPRVGRFDVRSALTLAAGITLLLLAVLAGHETALGAPALRVALALGAAAALLLFVRRQRATPDPLLPLDLVLRSPTAAPYLAGIALGTTIFGVDTFVPLFVQGARGGTAGAAGAVVTPLVLGWAASATAGARAVVRFGFRRTSLVGGSLVSAGLAFLVTAVAADAGVGVISAACLLVGFGLGPCSISQVLVVQHLVPEERRGVATSLVPFTRTVGGSLGVGALGGLLASGLARRLGSGASQAGRLLSGSAQELPGVSRDALRLALEGSLLPVFSLLLLLSLVNVLAARRFPDR